MKKSTKILLYHNRDITSKLKSEYNKVLPTLELVKIEAEKLIGRKLSTKEMELIFLDKLSFVANMKSIVSNEFKYPSSPISFNLLSMGLSYEGLENSAEAIPEHGFVFSIEDNEFGLLDSELKRIQEAGNQYCSNSNQITAYKALANIIKSLDELKKVGAFYNRSSILQGFNGFLNIAENDGVKINGSRIQSIQ